jgi:hypothetical protein
MFVPYQWANVGNALSLVVIMGYPPYLVSIPSRQVEEIG